MRYLMGDVAGLREKYLRNTRPLVLPW